MLQRTTGHIRRSAHDLVHLVSLIMAVTLLLGALASCSHSTTSTPTASVATAAGSVPDVVGKPVAAAEKDLKDAGFAVVVVIQRTGPANPPPLGTVLSEKPAAGSSLPPGGKVTIVVYQELGAG